jgi:hypothetical protein
MLIAFGATPPPSRSYTGFTPEMAAAEIGENELLRGMHHKRHAEARPILAPEMDRLIQCALRGQHRETVAFLQSLQAQDAIHSVVEAARVVSSVKALTP